MQEGEVAVYVTAMFSCVFEILCVPPCVPPTCVSLPPCVTGSNSGHQAWCLSPLSHFSGLPFFLFIFEDFVAVFIFSQEKSKDESQV